MDWGISGPSGETRNFHRQKSPRVLLDSLGRARAPGEISSNTRQMEAHQSARKGPGPGGGLSQGSEGLVSCINLAVIHR